MKFVNEILQTKQIKLISFDIFDTIMFRTVNQPKQVFEIVGEKIKSEILDDIGLDPQEFVLVRERAEILARKQGQVLNKDIRVEVTIDDIYNWMPDIISNKERVKEVEIETEHEVCYLNEDMYEMLQKVSKDYKVVLTSDMYLPSAVIQSILENIGFNMNCVDAIFVSCEYGGSKREGKLYEKLMETYGLKAEEILHIGDNSYSDIKSAKMKGIHTFWYDGISNNRHHFPASHLEGLQYGSVATSIWSLRSALAAKYCEDEWFSLGAIIFGPLYACAMEWVLDIADKERVNIIRPLMREGAFLSELLLNAADYRDNTYDIVPLYVSRQAVWLPSLENADVRDVRYVCGTLGLRISDVHKIFRISCKDKLLETYYDVDLAEAKNVIIGEQSLYEYVVEYFSSEESLMLISENARKEKKIACQYYSQMGMEQRCITLDIGWRGTIQHKLNKIIKNAFSREDDIHLLLYAVRDVIANMCDGTTFRWFVSDMGINKNYTKRFVRILEMLNMCYEGTTVGYSLEEGKAIPVLGNVEYGDRTQLDKIYRCQRGIIEFQRQYLQLKQKNSYVAKLHKNPRDVMAIISRFFTLPLPKEAKMFEEFEYDQNIGANILMPIFDEEVVAAIDEFGYAQVEEVFPLRKLEYINWIKGIRTKEMQLEDIYQFSFAQNYWLQAKVIRFCQRILKKCSGKTVVVGAGNVGRLLYYYLNICLSDIEIICFVDNNEELHGMQIDNIPICPMIELPVADNYIIGTVEYISELKKQVEDRVGSQNIFTIF